MAKILLVEDNEMNRDMLSRRLERKGYQIVMAVDGGAGAYVRIAADLIAATFGGDESAAEKSPRPLAQVPGEP